MTAAACGFPSLSRAIDCPAASTCTFCRTRRVPAVRSCPAGRVARTSTRVPGVTKPATPITSSTRTLTARIPSGIRMGRPPPASLRASFPAMSGSLVRSGATTPRPTTSATVRA